MTFRNRQDSVRSQSSSPSSRPLVRSRHPHSTRDEVGAVAQ
jgi:hypothetical protein